MEMSDANQETLDKWLKSARRMDSQALSKLCAHYYPKILRFMRYRVGSNLAEDLTGEVIVKIMRSIENQSGRFEPWLYRMARNVIIDHVRYRSVRPETELSEEMSNNLINEKSPDTAVSHHMDIQTALEQVSDEHREFLSLKFIQGLDNHEISEITGQNLNAIRAMQFRALKAMRDVLAPEGVET
ncbi:RNA polymerase sigma factor [Kiritimatiellaeota bacterium B1221]|nr:RNA polymerase sigma factor [Kiritimatiellaeota bacterium B1221]